MKKITTLFIGLILLFSLTACGGSQQAQATVPATTPEPVSETSSESEAPESQTEETTGGKTLDVYFSATGSTEKAANTIAEATNADIFELEPVEAYNNDDLNYRDENSRVVFEHDNPDEQNVALVSTTVPDWESYDTVFIGYPIWWQIAA